MGQNIPESSYFAVYGSIAHFYPNEEGYTHMEQILIALSEQDTFVIEDWIRTYKSPHTHNAYRRDILELLTSLQKPLAFW